MYDKREFSNRLPNSGYKKADKLKRTLTEVKNNTQFGIELYRLIYIK